ncbi:MAG: hypothetical protein LBN97_07555, partial [Oscillospiraceae bacterium]|nr:hypothetical protein [Oscillospiraceae bacterium]
EHIISGLTERSETIDLAAYSVEKDRFSEIYTEILYDHPEFFYVDSTVSVIYHSSTLLMDSAKPVYTFSNLELPTKITQFKRALASALDKIPEGLTYRETVTNINDWIVKNTTPDSKSRPTYVSAYDVLIHKRGTPGAYASAFKLLADARGVTNRIVGSDAMSVSWNQVYLGNTWYHIDCAMNDSLGRNVVLFLTDEEISQDIGGFSYYDWTVKGYSDPAQPAFKLPAAQISPSPSPSPTPSSSPKPSPSPSHSPSPTPTPTPSPSPSPTPPNVPDIAPSKNAQTFEEYVIDQLSQLKSKIDISRFGLHYSEAMKRALALVDTNPELFYVYNPIAYVTYNDSKGIAYDLTPQYAYPLSRIPAMKADFELAVNNAVRSIKRGATERETIDNINDWICDNARYDMSLSRFNAYNIFVEGIGVCDGYSRAFKVLCDRFGITCRIVTSDPMDHSWNQVYLDGAWYHIDVTWDDDLGGEYDAFFLKTDYEFLHPANAADKHYDWQVGR